MNIDNQTNYWDSVAEQKTFTHPVNLNILNKYLDKDAIIVDYGCGYGRITGELKAAGFKNISGYDTSAKLVNRGRKDGLPIYHIESPDKLPLADISIDSFVLFTVLTCIPSNSGQADLLTLLYSKLKPGGFIYISDYYLQENEISKSRYTYFNNDKNNYGVFVLPEGATLRHHQKEWIATLVKEFTIKEAFNIEVKTMNGNKAEAFQIMLQK
ncbi:MAG: methyltransferase domain-containing protein [Ferruginibacter sp.]